jgi:hypothetical protein
MKGFLLSTECLVVESILVIIHQFKVERKQPKILRNLICTATPKHVVKWVQCIGRNYDLELTSFSGQDSVCTCSNDINVNRYMLVCRGTNI